MAATSKNFDTTVIKAGTPGTLWAKVALPGAAARITLESGTPEAVANPNAINLGMTKEGATFTIKPTFEDYFSDEYRSPIKTAFTGMEANIEAELLQVEDFEVLENCTQGFSARANPGGYEEMTLGSIAFAYVTIALIFPTEADPTKYGVFNLYQAYNVNGLDTIQIARQAQGGCSVNFKGTDITTRADADTLGNYWKEV